MPALSFGTAQLTSLPDGLRPETLLAEAWRVGFRRFDTAPMYAGGAAEGWLGAFLAGRDGIEVVTTKAGLPPDRPPGAKQAVVRAVKGAVPAPVLTRLRDARDRRRAAAPPERERASGRFAVPDVVASVEESLRRLDGRIDRLLLHEVRPLDVTPELVDALAAMVGRGDVGEVGVGTRNGDTAEAVARGGELFTVANLAVGPLHEPVVLPASVTTRIGHGLLGGGGRHVQQLAALLSAEPDMAERWSAATAGTEFAGPSGLTDLLLSRAPQLAVTEVLVATTRLGNVARAHQLAGRTAPLPGPVVEVLDALVARAPVDRQ